MILQNACVGTRHCQCTSNLNFTPHRSTIDRIITLQLLLQTRREFCRPLWIAYVDLKAAFDLSLIHI